MDPDNKFFKDSHKVDSEANVPKFTRSSNSTTDKAGDKEVKSATKPNPFGEAKARDEYEYIKKKEEEKKSEPNTPVNFEVVEDD